MASKAKQVQDQLTADLVAEKNVSESIEVRANKALLSAESRRRELIKYYTSETKVKVQVSPMYRPYFGNIMPVVLNGISIYVPIDGNVHSVPKSFANEIERRRKAIDTILLKQRRMSEVQSNFESTPGELQLF